MEAKVIYEQQDYFDEQVGPYGYTKVGLLIEDRAIWLATCSDSSEQVNFEKWEGIAKKISAALNDG